MAGRPTEGVESLPKEWYNDILELYKEGGSDVEVKAMVWQWRGSFSNDLWDRWIKEEEQFSETIKMGRVLSQSWWTKEGRTNLKDREFSYTGWYMNMKNRFKWTDRIDETSKGEKKEATTIINLGQGEAPTKTE